MSFVSFAFPAFFMLVISVYYGFGYIAQGKFQWVILLISSYIFYTWLSPLFAAFIIFSTLTTWLFALLISFCTDDRNRTRKLFVVLSLFCQLGLLGFLKYTNFIIGTFNHFGTHIQYINCLVLPLGISFYTFQSIGYLIDVYRGVCEAERNIFKYALFVSYFPHISQGPIGRFNRLAPQLFSTRSISAANFERGCSRILTGYFEKLVIAGRLAPYVTTVFDAPENYSGLTLFMAVIFYSVYLYADFSGYMNIALGCSHCLGISLDENFDKPYFSSSIAEYWRRWHITLGTWFKDYLYYPLLRSPLLMNLNKKLSRAGHKEAAKFITVSIALLIVWFMTGLWHGAAWHYIVWGLWHGFFIITSTLLEKQYNTWKNALHISDSSWAWHAFKILRTYCIVLCGYIFFAAHSLSDSLLIIRKITTDFHVNSSSIGQALLPFIPSNIAVAYALIAITYSAVYLLHDALKNCRIPVVLSVVWKVFMVASIILFGYFGSSNFVYLQF